MEGKWKSLKSVQFFVTPWTVTHHFPQSMEFSKQESWSELLFPYLGDLPNPGIEPGSPALQSDSLTLRHNLVSTLVTHCVTLGKPHFFSES